MNISKFFEEHYVTSTIAFLAVIVSASQIWIASIDKNKELELAKLKNDVEFKQKQVQFDRSWKYQMTEFMAKNKDSIFSDDIKIRENMKKIMLVSFPPEITRPIFDNLSKVVDQEYKDEWLQAKNVSKRIGEPTAYIHIVDGFPEEILDLIADTIAEGDVSFSTNDEYVDKSLTDGDVRYFNVSDKEDAENILQGMEQTACSAGYDMSLQLLPLINNNDRNIPGTIEVWLTPESVKKISKNNDPCL